MQRARRLASITVIAALAIGGVAACRADPAVAAYVGPNKITEAQVDAVFADARVKLDNAVEQFRKQQEANPAAGQQAPPPGPVDLPIKRADVVTTLVGRDVLKALATARGVKPVQTPTQEITQAIGLPEDAQYTVAYAEMRGYLDALSQEAAPAEVTDADLRRVYDRLAAGKALQPGATSFQAFSANMRPQDRETIGRSLGVRNAVLAEVKKLNATINPRYGAAEMGVLFFRGADGKSMPLVDLTFDASSGDAGPVRDLA
ncbi:MAG TPA: hypothetical protein VF755_25610 [Catenuloplanes sp.]|jgi:hypothetical protein